jgi:hypothetical protein
MLTPKYMLCFFILLGSLQQIHGTNTVFLQRLLFQKAVEIYELQLDLAKCNRRLDILSEQYVRDMYERAQNSITTSDFSVSSAGSSIND